MRKRIESMVLACLFACGACASGQASPGNDEKPTAPPADEKAGGKTFEQLSLDELLALALKNNPDLLVAEAKVREAEAEYSRTRLQLSQKIAVLQKSIDAAKKTVDEANSRYERMKELVKKSLVSVEELKGAELTVLRFKAELGKLEAEIPYLIGKLPHDADNAPSHSRDQRSRPEMKSPHGAEAEKFRKALSAPVNLSFTSTPLTNVVQDLRTFRGVSFLININEKDAPTITLKLEQVSLGAALQAIEDIVPGVRFTVRDYGILVTYKEELPPNALSVHDFLKSDPDKEKPSATNAGKTEEISRNTPAEKVEGAVKKVDSGDLILINVGSDSGLAKGHTLEVFRLEPKPMYLGTIRILEVKPTEAVGKVVGKQREPIKEGDRVTSQIVNK